MKIKILKCAILIISILIFYGCPSAPPKIEKETVSKPAMIIQVASLNLSNLNKRIERKNISALVKILKHEQVEILAVQGISRYPGVTTRIDFVNELSSQTDWRNIFGEMLNIAGRQTGNAIFSTYPILSHYNQAFDKVKSENFESALQVTIDAGVRSVVVVSTQIPPKANAAEQAQCIKTITTSIPDATNTLAIITGNLPSIDNVNSEIAFKEISPVESVKRSTSKMWYLANISLKPLNTRVIETELGEMLFVQLGLFR